DLPRCGTWHAPSPTTAAQHHRDALYIRTEAAALQVQSATPWLHGRAALWTGLCPSYRFLFLRTRPFIHWSLWGIYVVMIPTVRLERNSTTTWTGSPSAFRLNTKHL